jgi:alpha-beta hydrolase superfamily lysophospholipase
MRTPRVAGEPIYELMVGIEFRARGAAVCSVEGVRVEQVSLTDAERVRLTTQVDAYVQGSPMSRVQPSSILDAAVLNQGLMAPAGAKAVMDALSLTYSARNTPNPAFMNIFPADNKGETKQNREALEATAKAKGFAVFDMEGAKPLDWQRGATPGTGAYTLAVSRKNIEVKSAPVVVMMTSNTHVANDILSMPVVEDMVGRGITLALVEYPGYGASFGTPSKKAWTDAVAGAIAFMHGLTGKKVNVLAHSIGGAVAFEAVTHETNKIASVTTFGAIHDTMSAAKDQASYGSKSDGFWSRTTQWVGGLFNQALAYVLIGEHLFGPEAGLTALANAQVPTVIMHGTNDASVPVTHHAKLFEDDLAARGSPKTMRVQTFEAGHEDLFVPSAKAYHELWSTIDATLKD